MNKRIVLIGVVFIVLAIILGAFGAHALKQVLTAEKLTSFETGVRYQMYHGLALLIIGLSANKFNFDLKWFIRLLVSGIVLFSGSIYLLSFQEILGIKLGFLGPITPIGGVLLIAGWILLFIKLLRG